MVKGSKVLQDQLNEMEAGIEEGGGGGGRRWRTIELSAEDLENFEDYSQISGKFTTPIDPSDFKNDFIRIVSEIKAASRGEIPKAGDTLTNLRVDMLSTDFNTSYTKSFMGSAMANYGFDHNYYRTVALWAGETVPEGGEPTGEATQGLAGNNVVYMQDVTVQDWEIEDVDVAVVDPGEGIAVQQGRAAQESLGGAYVLAFKGSDGVQHGIFRAMEDDQKAAYWDTTKNDVSWVDVEKGVNYAVTFDGIGTGEHGTLRWLVSVSTETGEVEPVPMTEEAVTALKTTGVTFSGANAYAIVDEISAVKGAMCLGVYASKELCTIFSWNTPFEDLPDVEYTEQILSPFMYSLDIYSYMEWDEEQQKYVRKTETEGEYVWMCTVGGDTISVVVPKTDLSTYVVDMEYERSLDYKYIYRHTFTITTPDLSALEENDWAINATFCAVNGQFGDSSMQYIIGSDAQGQFIDWVLPCQGYMGQVDGSGAVTTWYPILKINAGVTTPEGGDSYRAVRFSYYNTTNNTIVANEEVVTSSNMYDYAVADFRTEIASYLADAERGIYIK